MQAELLKGADLPAGCWLMGNDRRGFMAAVACKDTPWIFYKNRKDAEALAVFCHYLPDEFFPADEPVDMFEGMRLKKYARKETENNNQLVMF